MLLRSHRDVSCGDQLLYLSMGCEPHIWRMGHFWGILELFLLDPISAGGKPAGVGREQHLDAVSRLLGNKGGIHARHCAHCRISHAAVVWQTLMNLKAVA